MGNTVTACAAALDCEEALLREIQNGGALAAALDGAAVKDSGTARPKVPKL